MQKMITKQYAMNSLKLSPNSIFSKVDVMRLINSILVNPTKIITTERTLQVEMVSLFDFMHQKPAGPALGKMVYLAAKAAGEKMQTREISNKTYKGNVLLYRKVFLEQYFADMVQDMYDFKWVSTSTNTLTQQHLSALVLDI